MLYRVTHRTRYDYEESVGQCHNVAFMMPRNTLRQTCLQADVLVEPQPVALTERRDYFGNRVCHFAIEGPHRSLEVTARSLVDVREGGNAGSQLDFGNTCAQVLGMLADDRDSDTLLAREFVLPSPLVEGGAEIRDYAGPFFAPDRPFLSAVRTLTQSIFQEFRYDTTFSDVSRGRVPGLRPPRHRVPAGGGAAGPLRQRLPRDPAPAGASEAEGGGRDARVGVRGAAGRPLARPRPDQRLCRGRPLCHDRVGTGLS